MYSCAICDSSLWYTYGKKCQKPSVYFHSYSYANIFSDILNIFHAFFIQKKPFFHFDKKYPKHMLGFLFQTLPI